MKRKGFTLAELLVVFVVSAIILTYGYNSFKKWREAVSIEGDVQRIYTLLQKERMKAFTNKLTVVITCSDKTLTVEEDDGSGTPKTLTLELENNFKVDNSYHKIKINEKGLFSITGTIVYDGSYSSSPAYDCVVVSRNRIRMERCL
ncbi:prepilin-type N-terminal cleavage/methylation domain-containing protein [Phorcysia thermohydrogeniphila]|uniref:Prepilin-type N-terminal cleavage/methylation domain-containing protein n=1 Tax=Phorcysia thermohydrogeniphila TaxID=936138 RepID=A0A4R1GIB6_9BACT|nr:prepilin-type N-terminal cleavage/methylation domain-containing protein [Phorcysia thermohydrogeniphila]TCK06655.1 prepilin-type N-terminal cleavage/methylation domain-containing protein [Phorcysia thermohydrogeniphila]